MIKYALNCQSILASGDVCNSMFDGWFKNADACQTQLNDQRLSCPSCKGRNIHKSLQSPHLANKAGKKRAAGSMSKYQTSRSGSAPKVQPAKPNSSAVMTPEAAEAYKNLYAMTKKVQDHIKSTCDDVGTEFAEVARKIHYGEAPKRGVFGQVTETDAKDLVEEGISIAPLPTLPKADS